MISVGPVLGKLPTVSTIGAVGGIPVVIGMVVVGCGCPGDVCNGIVVEKVAMEICKCSIFRSCYIVKVQIQKYL